MKTLSKKAKPKNSGDWYVITATDESNWVLETDGNCIKVRRKTSEDEVGEDGVIAEFDTVGDADVAAHAIAERFNEELHAAEE